MKTVTLSLMMILFLSACTGQPAKQIGQSTASGTAMQTPTMQPPATSTPQPTATQIIDYRPDYEKVKADPWTATDAEKSGYDIFVRQQLAEVGIANAENMPDQQLLEAVIPYQQNLIEKGGLTNPEDYLVELPLSVHELIRTDINSLIPVHDDSSRAALYGIGGQVQPDKDRLLNEVQHLTGFLVYGKDIQIYTTDWTINGDLVLLYKSPGVDPNLGIGAIVRIYDDDKIAYREVFIPTANSSLNPGDLCVYKHSGESKKVIPCPTGIQRSQAWRFGDGKEKQVDLAYWLKMMVENQNPNVEINIADQINNSPTWSDGIPIVSYINYAKK